MEIVCPVLLRYLKLKIIAPDIEHFMLSLVKQNLEYREQNNISRKDFFQLMVQLRNGGMVEKDGQWDSVMQQDETKKFLSIEQVAAQSFVFWAAGFETSSTAMSYCLYEFAKNEECQQKAQQEIDELLQQNNGVITYDIVQEMQYLENCIDG